MSASVSSYGAGAAVCDVRTLCVVGGGIMGSGIAQVAARAGLSVSLVEVDDAALDRTRGALVKRLDRWATQGTLNGESTHDVLSRVAFSVDLIGAAAEADFVVEAVSERLDLKRELFGRLDAACRPGTVLASNTSQLRIGDLASATTRPEQVIGTHFFNPPDIMRLVEVVVAEQTAPETVEQAVALAGRLGKEAVVCRDMQGFITSRVIAATMLEAIRLLDDGVASMAEIDRACRLAFNWPMGPLELSDFVGLDTLLYSADGLRDALGERFDAPDRLRRLVAQGSLGRKSGSGIATS